MNKNKCPDCESETHLCEEHQKARIEYESIDRGDVDRDRDPVYLGLLEKYGEIDTEKIICGACQTIIEPGKEIMVTMEKFSHHERTWPACSEECADILREIA